MEAWKSKPDGRGFRVQGSEFRVQGSGFEGFLFLVFASDLNLLW
jgi:hypothetical protein